MYNNNPDEMDDLFDDVIGSQEEEQELPDFLAGDIDVVDDLGLDDFDKAPKVKAHALDNDQEEEQEQEEAYDDQGQLHLEGATEFIVDLLKQKGITDPDKLLWIDDDGNEVTKSFYELDYEEQLNILNTSTTTPEVGLDDSEIDLINTLRENEVSFEDLVEFYKAQAIEEYKQSLESGTTEIDSLSDEEIYILDLKASFNMTDDEILETLDHDMLNETLFKRKVDKIRAEYKAAEEQQRETLSLSEQQKREEQFQELYTNLNDVAVKTEDIGGIDLSDDDKDEIMSLILEKDINNKSTFDKLLADPDAMFKMAWFATKGQEAFDILHNYYKDQIESVRKAAFDKGKKEASTAAEKQKAKEEKSQKTIAIRRKTPTRSNIFADDDQITSLDELW